MIVDGGIIVFIGDVAVLFLWDNNVVAHFEADSVEMVATNQSEN